MKNILFISSMSISYHNWWGEVAPEWKKFLNNMFPWPVEIYSIFGEPPTNDKKVRVQISGESTFYDPSLFQVNMIPHPQANVPCLYAFIHIQLLKDSKAITQSLQQKRVLETIPSRFCLFSVSTTWGKERNEFFHRLSQYKKVDSCGKLYNNITPPVGRTDSGHQSQEYFDFIRQYKFMICFENKSQPYYLTEKLINAYHCGTIPIYWGCPNVSDYVNMDAMLYLKPNYTEEDVNRLIEEIVALDKDDALYKKKFETIFFKGNPDGLSNGLPNGLSNGLPDEFNVDKVKEKIRNVMCKVFHYPFETVKGAVRWSKIPFDPLKHSELREYVSANYDKLPPYLCFVPESVVDFPKGIEGMSRDGVFSVSREEIMKHPKSFYETIEYVVIHCSENKERAQNIVTQERILGKPIQRFEAIMGKDIDVSNLDMYDPRIQYTFKPTRGMNEVGCYLSHLMLLKERRHKKSGYTVIFEDDFSIQKDNLSELIQDYIQEPFDFLHLGHWTDPRQYKRVTNELYEYIPNRSGFLYCTHAFIIPNARIQDLYEQVLHICEPIDWVYARLINKKGYTCKIVHPQVVFQDRERLPPIIGPIME